MIDSKCICCGKVEQRIFGTWFCTTCHEAKEAAYRECERLGITHYSEIIEMREKYLMREKMLRRFGDE